MKKLILLLLLSTFSYGQAGFEKIALTANTVSSSSNKINTQEADGQINYINASDLPISVSVQDSLSNVLHKTGNETKSGNLTLNDNLTMYGTSKRCILTDGTVDLSAIDITSTPSVLSTKPKFSLARTTDLITTVSEHGFADNSIFDSNNTGAAYNSFDAFININGTLGKDHYLGYQQRSIYNGSGTLDFYQGYRDAPKFTNGTVQRRFGFRISDVTLSGSAIVERNIGLKIEAITGGTVYNKPIESDGTATSTFAGGITSALALEGNTIVKTGASSTDLLVGTGTTFSTNSIYQLRGSYGGSGESLNDLITSGIWLLSTSSTGTKPLFVPRNVQVIRSTSSAAFITQIAHHTSTGRTASRNSIDTGATWSAWLEYANVDSQTFTGTPTLPTGTIGVTQTAGNSTTALATTAFVTTADNLKANLASPALTGTPTAPTATAGTNTTQVATTAFVLANARPYTSYVAVLTQTGTSAPVATVLENTLSGTPVWSYVSVGIYDATLTGVFNSAKTAVFFNKGQVTGTTSGKNGAFVNTTDTVRVMTVSNGSSADGEVNKGTIEIRVYP